MRQTTRIPLDDLERELTRETLEELIERGFSDEEIAEFVGDSCTLYRVLQARSNLGVDRGDEHVPKPRPGTIARKLWEMDAEDL
ncbi:hypothetical protein [Halomontanus rarus]|uniref:hypothetical protein n=1 Tax=Halomontanus rarus TaxID=3034020 RepID=UPI0023E89188|nr:hypothetical protein [Halovivax sp. TS33]